MSHVIISYRHYVNQSIHVTGGMAVASLSASLPQRISAAMDHLCQIMLNQKLLCKFEMRCKFSYRVKGHLLV